MSLAHPATFTCALCSAQHPGPPLSYFFRAPEQWSDERFLDREQCVLDEEVCIIENSFFFLKGNIELPISHRLARFVWTIWVSLSEANFLRAISQWDDPLRTKEPPYFAWLCSQLPGYPPTLDLKTNVHMRPPGVRPLVELEPTDHPLALEQRAGISWEKILSLAADTLHKSGSATVSWPTAH